MKKLTIILILIWVSIMSYFSLQAIAPGETAENFTLPDYNGKNHSLTDYQNQSAIVLIFVSTRCPVSNAYNERMEKLFKEYSGKKVTFLGINANRREDAAMIKTHCAENGITFSVLKDEDNAIADKFGAKVTPEVFVLSPKLQLLYHGHIDDSQRESQVKQTGLKDALDSILAGKAVADAVTKPFGCSIKRDRD